MLADEIRRAVEAAPREKLPDVALLLWRAFGAGQVSEAEAEALSVLIEARKAVGSTQWPVGGLRQFGSAFPTRKPQRPPERSVAIERRRRWAAAGRMPPAIACKFSPGEQAALAVIAVEVTKRNACSMAIGAIAAIAGVSESTVKRAVRQARALGFLTVQERRLSRYRSDTNIVHIISKAWLYWLELRRSGGGVQRCTGTSTGSSIRRRERQPEAAQKGFRDGGRNDRSGDPRGVADCRTGLEGHPGRRALGAG